MSIAKHLDVLSRYGAMAVRIVPAEGDPEDMLGEGGGLEAAYESLGRAPIVGVLRDARVAELLLADGELQVEVRRDGAGGRLKVSYGKQVIVDEPVVIPPIEPMTTGPFFRPERSTEVTNLDAALADASLPLFAVAEVDGLRWYSAGLHGRGAGHVQLRGQVPARDPASLGADSFRAAHGVKWAYVAGAMAGGIASADMVIAMARAGLLGFFGSGGLPLEPVKAALSRMAAEVPEGAAWGTNLLHNPAEPGVEEATVDLFLEHGVTRVSASAYMGLSPAVVRFRLTGIHAGPDGRAVCPHHVFAKVSRPEVAEHFLKPAPDKLLEELRAAGVLTAEQVVLARTVPIAEDITAEGDSGGHTDHRPLIVLLPILQGLRDRIAREQGYAERGIHLRVGAAGGLGTPSALWAVFAMGADFVLTGSVNQATVEAGTSDLTKNLLAQAAYTDVASGPAPDMFELGAKVQVLSRGSMYAQRSQRLYDVYKRYASLQDIPADVRAKLEKQIIKRDLDEVWEGTRDYWAGRDPAQVAKADKNPKHKMALTFRWYLGMTSRWARIGELDRKRDFQIWCGPAMGGFNTWVRGTALEDVGGRTVAGVAEALMQGAAAEARTSVARSLGLIGA